jgi:condensin complex subunit 1
VPVLSKIFDLVVSGLSAEADLIHNDLESDESDSVQSHRTMLEMYGFLLQWLIAAIESKAAEKSTSGAAPKGRGKGTKMKAGAKSDNWDSSSQIIVAFETMSKVLKLKFTKLFVTTSERDTFVNLFTRSAYLVLENEQRAKSTPIRMHAFKVLCIAIKHHGHGFGMSQFMKMLTIRRTNINFAELVLL